MLDLGTQDMSTILGVDHQRQPNSQLMDYRECLCEPRNAHPYHNVETVPQSQRPHSP